jgi:hypothetical protein
MTIAKGNHQRGRSMKVEQLKNYGKPLSQVIFSPEAEKQARLMMRVVRRELRKELGLVGVVRLLLNMRKQTKLIAAYDWSELKEHGLADRRFLDSVLQQAAAMKVLENMVGLDRASEFYRRLLDEAGYEVSASLFPSPEEFAACGNAFEAFKEYAKAMISADQREGVHEVDIVADDPSTLAYNVRYCAWNEVARKCGVSRLCYAGRCYGDEVFFNRAMPEIGVRYKRRGTLTLGEPVCDVRFELIDPGTQ